MKNLYYIHPSDDTQIVQNILFKEEKKNSSMNEEHMSFRLSISNRDNLDSVRNNEIIMKEKEDKLPKEMIKIMETFLKGNNFKKQRLSWIAQKICCKKEEDMTNSVKHYLYGKAILNYDLNIVVILKKMIEFETILSILFNENQLEVMKGIHPRFINDSMKIHEVKEKFRYKKKEITEERLENFIRALNDCSKDKSKLSKMIYKNFNT